MNCYLLNLSHYHEACVPTHQRRAVYAEPNTKPVAVLDYTNRTDAVKEDILWRQCVSKEEKAVSKWEDEWGFLVEYDSKVCIYISYIKLYYVMFYYSISCINYIILYHATSHHIIYYILLYYIILYYIILYCIISYYIIVYHIILCYIKLNCIILY